MTHQHALFDGSWLAFDSTRVWRRWPDSSAVLDLSWAPTWWILDLLVSAKLGGLAPGSSEWETIASQLDKRTFAPFAVVTAPLPRQAVASRLAQLFSDPKASSRTTRPSWPVQQLASPKEGPVAEAQVLTALDEFGRRRHRFTLLDGDFTASPVTGLVLHDCASAMNAPALVAVAELLSEGSTAFNLDPQPHAVASAKRHDGVERRAALASGPKEVVLMAAHLSIQESDLRAVGGGWLLDFSINPEALEGAEFVLNF